MDVVPVMVAVGLGVIVILIGTGALTQPEADVRTVSVAL
jgi:hypothetical protein